jgi:hypothetical protein
MTRSVRGQPPRRPETDRAAGNCRRKSIKYASARGLGGGADKAAQQSDFPPRDCISKKQK